MALHHVTDDTATRLALIEDRLASGGAAFHELRGKLGKLAWYGLGVLGAAFTVVWYASQVVSEVHEARREVRETQGQLDNLQTVTTALEGAQRDLGATVKTLTKAVEKLEAPPPASPGRWRPR